MYVFAFEAFEAFEKESVSHRGLHFDGRNVLSSFFL